ncbi:MAG: biopolymer transporter ExbD [Methanobrevibacter sp.]|jgi:biopolymer transport protein ExbD|nr:biopolymer transporter ExbD [Methanobrevibacter sp.]
MKLDVKRHREKIKGENPQFNLVPFIDILFTILIFLVITSNFNAADMDATGKPEASDTSGDSEYYLFPVANLEKVTVNGQDMSDLIRSSSIAVHSKVIDEGEIIIKPKDRSIIITTPSGMSPDQAVKSPE